ncbi:MAG: cyclic-di-AMP receptor [Clostridia bacterium]|nr:cyclic-di-AMP receptor [Clostridia bacterium]MBQ6708791.1 cyclic-di-AMP receptor [Clostridia bacterium]
MKLVIAIVNSDDSNNVVNGITKAGFYATKLPTTGGFMRAGNVTILVGVEDEKVDEVIEIVKTYSSERSELVYPMLPGSVIAPAVKVNVGGATIFVLDVEQFYKV